ncbi:YbaN family protein [Phytopseudomonas dryadis]|uniref:DUF454 domain-containing protein n=1 Tax=Phytopseudomonas dryadis TaxID=2487520 RepID=A0A4Q9QZH2_9GAMM|nr:MULTISPECIES: YbaN family protein [Pseudomonas]TBU90033.1 DUF454 domain-containing protein [Pseudomonas dryadis]TBV02669.1 DUF454 domain-containing protein [Pseudomonas dryadis]TBV15521.1 DUF454 domain-containing protein [Pseudomonas sp. FRB 230]
MPAHPTQHPGDPSQANASDRLKRLAYLLLAYLSLGCAILGVILPGLPATEFVLLAAWASAKSSPRLHHWLQRHRLFGPLLRDWRAGLVARRSKWIASLSMLLCFSLLLWHQPPLWLLLSAGAGMACGAGWLWSRAEPPRPADAGLERSR